jgi:hypothetical protein
MFDACPEPVEGAAMICKVLPLLKGIGQCLGGVRSPSPGEDHGQGRSVTRAGAMTGLSIEPSIDEIVPRT